MIKISADELLIVKSILRQCIPDVTVWAFGSRVNGEPKSYSDLDIAIIANEKMPLNQYTQLLDAFEESVFALSCRCG